MSSPLPIAVDAVAIARDAVQRAVLYFDYMEKDDAFRKTLTEVYRSLVTAQQELSALEE